MLCALLVCAPERTGSTSFAKYAPKLSAIHAASGATFADHRCACVSGHVRSSDSSFSSQENPYGRSNKPVWLAEGIGLIAAATPWKKSISPSRFDLPRCALSFSRVSSRSVLLGYDFSTRTVTHVDATAECQSLQPQKARSRSWSGTRL